MFESHRTFLSLSATLLSCLAAWLGYEARVRHQRKLEEQLLSINRELQRDYQEMEKLRSMSRDVTRTDYVSLASFTVASLVIGYTVGRFHGRRSAMRRHQQQQQQLLLQQQQQQPQNLIGNAKETTISPSLFSSSGSGSGSGSGSEQQSQPQRSFGRIFTKLKIDNDHSNLSSSSGGGSSADNQSSKSGENVTANQSFTANASHRS